MNLNKQKSGYSSIRWFILSRDKFRCQYCGRTVKEGVELTITPNIDHIFPESKGGTDLVNNLVTACYQCNHGKSNIELTDDIKLRIAEQIGDNTIRFQNETGADFKKLEERYLKERPKEEGPYEIQILKEELKYLLNQHSLPEAIKIYLGEFNNFPKYLYYNKASGLGLIRLDAQTYFALHIKELKFVTVSLNNRKLKIPLEHILLKPKIVEPKKLTKPKQFMLELIKTNPNIWDYQLKKMCKANHINFKLNYKSLLTLGLIESTHRRINVSLLNN